MPGLAILNAIRQTHEPMDGTGLSGKRMRQDRLTSVASRNPTSDAQLQAAAYLYFVPLLLPAAAADRLLPARPSTMSENRSPCTKTWL